MDSQEDQPLFMQGHKQEHEKEFESLGDRMKHYEAINDDRCVPPTESFILRMDGHCYSKFTKPLRKPFDDNFMIAMNRVAADLLVEFHAQTVYTHSDEISIVVDQVCTEEDLASEDTRRHKCHMFNGRHQKLLSLAAGYCSARFNYHMAQLILKNDDARSKYDQRFLDTLAQYEQCFDARIITFDGKKNEIVNNILWRSVYDANRNAVSTYARTLFSHKELTNKNTKEMIEMMATKDLDWITVPLYYKHGSYCKKEKYEKTNEDGSTCIRTRVVWKTFKISYSDQMVQTMLAPYWSTDDQLGDFQDITEMIQPIVKTLIAPTPLPTVQTAEPVSYAQWAYEVAGMKWAYEVAGMKWAYNVVTGHSVAKWAYSKYLNVVTNYFVPTYRSFRPASNQTKTTETTETIESK